MSQASIGNYLGEIVIMADYTVTNSSYTFGPQSYTLFGWREPHFVAVVKSGTVPAVAILEWASIASFSDYTGPTAYLTRTVFFDTSGVDVKLEPRPVVIYVTIAMYNATVSAYLIDEGWGP
mgnify:FL=1